MGRAKGPQPERRAARADAPRSSPTEEAERLARLVDEKEAAMAARGRCAACWHTREGGHCICARLRAAALLFDLDVRFAVYVHFKEYYSAGNSGKMLAAAAPANAEVFVHGRRGDDARLAAALERPIAEKRAALLFPDGGADAVDAFFGEGEGRAAIPRVSEGRAAFWIVVVDAVWPLARKLARHLDRVVRLPHVRLETDLVSVFARTQSENGRVCTIEAIALFLRECGESADLFAKLVGFVQTNNRALGHAYAKKADLYDAGPTMGHPAWYYRLRASGWDDVPGTAS